MRYQISLTLPAEDELRARKKFGPPEAAPNFVIIRTVRNQGNIGKLIEAAFTLGATSITIYQEGKD